MILIEEVSRSWERDGDWRVAPDGVAWIAAGARIIVGANAAMHEWASIGEGARIGRSGADAIDLGFADGYRKCIAQVAGVAYIGAGCRWFPLDEAIAHWSAKGESRALTMCLMEAAVAIAGYRGWATSAALAKGE